MFKAFYNKMETHLSNAQYNTYNSAYPENFPPLPCVECRVEYVSTLKSVSFDCCKNSCMAFTGPLTELNACSWCKEPHRKPNGKPYQQYQYLPLIPQLQAQYANAERAALLSSYRASQYPYTVEVTDIFQGKLYRELRKRRIEVNGEVLLHRYFDSPRDIALGLSTNGFGPFKGPRAT
ncbi:hypothetical protein CALCODRAFT_537746, partial [Calocera cornea HHB12733]